SARGAADGHTGGQQGRRGAGAANQRQETSGDQRRTVMTDSPVGLREFNRVVRTTLLVPVTMLALLAGLLVWQVEQGPGLRTPSLMEARVIGQLLQLEQRVTDQETSLRAYQLTGLPSQLVPYNSAGPEIEAILTQLHHLPTASGISKSHVDKLEQDIRAWQTWASGVLGQPAPAPEA